MSDSSLCYGDSGSAYCCWKYVWLLEYNWHGGRLEWRQSSAEIKRISLNGFCFYVQQFSNEYQKLLRWTSSRSIIAKRKKKPRPLYRHVDLRHIIKCPSAVSANTRCHVFLYSSTFLQRNMSNCFQFQISLCYQMVSLCYWKVFSWKIKINCDSSETNYRYSLKQNSTWTIFTKFSYSF